MDDKYGIELDLILGKFRQKMQEVKNAFKGVSDKKINVDANTAQLNYIKKQIQDINRLLMSNIEKPFLNTTQVLKYEAQVEKLKNQYNQLIAKQNEASSASAKMNTSMSKDFNKMTSKIKRFGLSLLSIRSIFSLVSRASSAYLAQDTALANKLQSVWAGLGALLAPIIEGIVNILAKAVKYIAIFIKALTGVDLLARATAKSMKGTAKAAKGLNNALAGFDDLQNLDTDAGGGETDLGAGLSGLNDVEINTEWADKIKAFGDWVRTEWPAVLSLLAGVVTFFKIVVPLVETFGLKIGIIKALGIGIAVAGIVYAISSLIQYLKNPTWENFGKIIQGIGIAVIGVGTAFLSLPAVIAGVVILIVGTIVKYWEEIKAFLQKGIDWLTNQSDWVHEHLGAGIGFIYDTFVGAIQLVLNILDNVFTTIKGVFDGIIKFIKGVFTGDWKMAWEGIKQIFTSIWNGIKGIVSSVWNFIKDLVVNIAKTTGDIISKVFKSVVNGVLGAIENILNAPIKTINRLIGVINEVPGINLRTLSTFNLPRLNVGTNYVPEDQLAMIHKGEAVVPKKFNSKEYFGGSDDETKSLLRELIDKVDGIEINPYTTIRDVGKASLSYINNKSRQLGESVVY